MERLHANGQHYIPITDPGVAILNGYFAYDIGTEMDIWVKNSSGQPFIGKVWPGYTTFPDWFNPETFDYWYQMLNYFHGVAAIDGLWIDMNEISNFCSGQCSEQNSEVKARQIPSPFDPNNPPYKINNRGNQQTPLDTGTMAMDAQHAIGLEYNTHNMFGFMEIWATSAAMERVRQKRSLVISRSTFAGSGKHGNHWTGDNNSIWRDLYLSIADILNFQMYGITFVGADICGFNGPSNEELCGRWIQLGSFYPFTRNHNAIGNPSQELYIWPAVANISREVLAIKYSLLPYYYTLMYRANQFGGTIWRPVFYQFTTDPNTWELDTQFMVGKGIMVSPVIFEGATTRDIYFPAAAWYDFYTYEQVANVTTQAQNITLDAPFSHIPVHILGGTIIPKQTPAYTTTESRNGTFTLIVPFDTDGYASGELYLDDGNVIDPVQKGVYTYIRYYATFFDQGQLIVVVENTGYQPAASAVLNEIIFLGINSDVGTVSIDGNDAKFTQSGTTLFVQDIATPITQAIIVKFD